MTAALIPQARTGLDDLTDRELVAAYRGGNRDAVAVLVTRHRERIRMVALAAGAGAVTVADVDDVEQQVALTLVRYLAGCRTTGTDQFTTWLDTVTRNAAIDLHRRRRLATALDPQLLEGATLPHPEGETTDYQFVNTQVAGALPLVVDDPGYGRTDAAVTVGALLDLLPPDQRAALALIDLADRDIDATAAVLGIPAGTVKSRRHRGLTTLRRRAAEQQNAEVPR